MKKKHHKKLAINKLQISKLAFSEYIKGGSAGPNCPEATIAPACPTGIGCTGNGNMGG